MIRPALRAGLALAASLPLFGCADTPPLSRADQAALEACRAHADAAYLEQNRAEMSLRDQSDTPYSVSGLPGVTSSGLSQRYERDEMVRDCLRASGRTMSGQSIPGAPAAPPAPAS